MVNPPFETPEEPQLCVVKGLHTRSQAGSTTTTHTTWGYREDGGRVGGREGCVRGGDAGGSGAPTSLSITATDDDTLGNPVLESLVAS